MSFFILHNPRFSTDFSYGQHKNENFNTGEAKTCEGCGKFISSLEWLPPYDVKVSKRKVEDLIFGTYIGFIASENFKTAFEKSGLKGLDNFKLVTLYYKNEVLTEEEYYYPDISLMNAFVNLSLLEFETEKSCSICQTDGSIIKGINGISLLQPDDIKEDIFFTTALGQSTIIVSDKFKRFYEENGFTNVKFIETEKFRWGYAL